MNCPDLSSSRLRLLRVRVQFSQGITCSFLWRLFFFFLFVVFFSVNFCFFKRSTLHVFFLLFQLKAENSRHHHRPSRGTTLLSIDLLHLCEQDFCLFVCLFLVCIGLCVNFFLLFRGQFWKWATSASYSVTLSHCELEPGLLNRPTSCH